jgi:hypothetical protein
MIILKGSLKFLLGLGIMICSIALMLSIFTRTTLLNQDFYLKSLEKSSYFTFQREEIDDGFKNYSLITSIPQEVFSRAVSDEAIRTITTDNINNTLAYMKHESGYRGVQIDESPIDTSVREYVAGKVGEGSQLSTVTKEAAAIVNRHAALFDVSAVIKYSQFQSFRNALYTAYNKLYVIAAMLLFLILSLFLVSRKKAGTFQLWLGGALVAGSLVILVPSLMGLFFNIPYRFPVENYYLKVGLSSIALGCLRNLVITGALVLAAGSGLLYAGIHKSEA